MDTSPTSPVRQIPAVVLRTWPEVNPSTWQWRSPLRLWAPQLVPGHALLVVLDAAHERALGQGIRLTDDEQHVYAELRMSLAASIGRETACQDGAPVTHETGRCVWCGLTADEHQAPSDDGTPTPQSTRARAADTTD